MLDKQTTCKYTMYLQILNVDLQQNSVSQGSVMAVTLFALNINGISELIPQQARFMSSSYAEGLQIDYKHSTREVGCIFIHIFVYLLE